MLALIGFYIFNYTITFYLQIYKIRIKKKFFSKKNNDVTNVSKNQQKHFFVFWVSEKTVSNEESNAIRRTNGSPLLWF